MGSLFSQSRPARTATMASNNREGLRIYKPPVISWRSTTVKPPDPKDEVTLRVLGVNLNIRENTKAHHTSDYDITDAEQGTSKKECLVARRGQPIDLTVNFNRPYNRDTDDLVFAFDFDTGSSRTGGRSHVEFQLSSEDVKRKWGGWLKSTDGNSIVVSIVPAVTCQVGRWKFSVDVVKKDDTGAVDVLRFSNPDFFYILFNPWCREDDTFLHDEALRQEYVLEEDGIVYKGSAKMPSGKKWAFGQFTDDVLDCCLWLLDKTMGNTIYRGNPVRVSRYITQVCNSNDADNGLIVGNWSGEYAGGTAPYMWNGSAEVFQQYYKNKKPVKYGQCWVFSGLCVTFCRALGIPCRSVTNFSSAHDTDGNLFIDIMYFDSDKTFDSVWNFHVWNEAWMCRPDLPEGYGGWQVIDATPQETSGGVFACGPASLVALRNGDLHYGYDAPFVYAEVNAERHYYLEDKDTKEVTLVYKDKNGVGKNISTKKVNSDEREDITLHYKYPEGSKEEEMVTARALMSISEDRTEVELNKDVTYTLECDPDTFIGQDLVASLVIKNTCGKPRTVSCDWGVDSTYYTGIHFQQIKREKVPEEKLKPNSEKKLTMTIPPDVYYNTLTDHCNVKLMVLGYVNETKSTHFCMDPMRFRKPHLTVKAPSSVKKGEKMTVEVSFQNPLNMKLTQCELSAEGHGLIRPTKFTQSNLEANATYEGRFDVVPFKPGTRQLVITYNCAQIYGVDGSQKVTVTE